MTGRRRTVAFALLTLALVACAGNDEVEDAGPSGDPGPVASPSPAVLNWSAPSTVQLSGGWTIAPAEGDAPLLDVLLDGRAVGQLEILRFPVATLEAVQAALEAGGSEQEALEVHAGEYDEAIRSDRVAGCGPDYGFAADPATLLDTASGPAVRYGFAGTLADGAPSERVVQFAGLDGETLVIVSAVAYDPGGCLANEGVAFTSEELERFQPVLTDTIRVSGLPPSDALG